jgi:hypothetical protein
MAKIKAKVKMAKWISGSNDSWIVMAAARHWLHSLDCYEKSNGSFRQGISTHQCLEFLAVVGLKQMG